MRAVETAPWDVSTFIPDSERTIGMIDVDSTVDHRNGVTFVRATVTNPQRTPQSVRLESQLDGPTWSPRVRGVTEPAWNGDAWEAIVRPGRSCGLGFASPAPPVDSPLELVLVRRADGADGSSAAHTIASLPDWSPSGDVVLRER